jgi:23S rRNA 5-hydroxycytidine C2501 synthase
MSAGIPLNSSMAHDRRILELLAPAKNADFGIAAIDHGADAVYIGGPAFGARANAGNDVASIARLAEYAHRFRARVYVTLNTILRDDELETARNIAWQVYDAGADALLVQDMGLLEIDLPPIALHASTQTDTRDAAKARFLQDVGFSQLVLARELSLGQIRAIAAQTQCALEFFVHGALCVSYSGQCYLSYAHTGRSANRGECSQACRLPYTLMDARGNALAHDRHLLSLKDNDQSTNLRALAEAGISSFKVEGRLKDLSYVKNVTAHYRILLDRMIEEGGSFRRASSGFSTFTFTPQPEKSFNRGATDYFVNGRQHGIEAFETPAFIGEPVGRVTHCGRDFIEIDADADLNNGDGFSYFDAHGELTGLRINRAEDRRLYPATMPDDLPIDAVLYRNRDQAFERLLEKKSAERRVRVRLALAETADGVSLAITDEDGVTATASATLEKQPANDAARTGGAAREHLGKLGTSLFAATDIELKLTQPWFLPASLLNRLRRDAVTQLESARAQAYLRPERAAPVEPAAVYPQDELDYLGNVLNKKARAFYERHGVRMVESAFESGARRDDVSLMVTRHCLRYSFNLCPLEARHDPARRGTVKAEPMTLVHGNDTLTLRFDCKRCEMHVIGRLRKSVPAQPVTFRPKSGR